MFGEDTIMNILAQRKQEQIDELQKRLDEAKADFERLKDATIGKCPRCSGDGYIAKYVGCDCLNDKPYIRLRCDRCEGSGCVEIQIIVKDGITTLVERA